MAFEANVRNLDGLAVLDLHGEVDGGADEALNAAYDEAVTSAPSRVLLNFEDVSYINSTGIALIVGLLAQARQTDRSIVACGLSQHYKEIFEITKIADFVTIFDTEQDAVSAAPTS